MKPKSIFFQVLLGMIFGMGRIHAEVDRNWADMTELRSVSAAAFDMHDTPYVFGGFGSYSAIAYWSKMGWQKPTQGGIWKTAQSLAIDKNGAIFVTGTCDSNVTFIPNGAAYWSNSAWQPLALGKAGYILSFVSDKDGNIYAGGVFDSIAGVPANDLAKWDGKNWSSLGMTKTLGDNSVGYILTDRQDALYFVRHFQHGGSSLFKWDGKLSTMDLSGINNSSLIIQSLAEASNGDLYLGGQQAMFVDRPVFYKFSNNVWSNIPGSFYATSSTTNGERLTDILPDDKGGLIATGSFYKTQGVPDIYSTCSSILWTGSEWKRCVDVQDGHFIKNFSGQVFSIGDYIFRKDGDKWLRCEMPPFPDPGVFAGGPNHSIYLASDNTVSIWDGFANKYLGDTLPGTISHMVVNKKGELFVGGSNWRTERPFVSKWNGSTWVAIPFRISSRWLFDMKLSGEDSLYVVNDRYTMKLVDTNWVQIHVGQSFTSGQTNAEFYTSGHRIAFDQENQLYISLSNSRYAKNDTGWILTEDSLKNTFMDLWYDKNQNGYMVSTKFHSLFNANANIPQMVDVAECTVLRWDGKGWEEIGAFDNSNGTYLGNFSISSHAFDSKNNLYVGGSFRRVIADSQTFNAPGVIKWDGKRWMQLGTGLYFVDYVSDWVSDIFIDSTDHVHVAGRFGFAGGKKCYGYSIYSDSDFSIPLAISSYHPPGKATNRKSSDFQNRSGFIFREDGSGQAPATFLINGRRMSLPEK